MIRDATSNFTVASMNVKDAQLAGVEVLTAGLAIGWFLEEKVFIDVELRQVMAGPC